MAVVRHKESIHSGQFMVSNFEAEAEDDKEILSDQFKTGDTFASVIKSNQLKHEYKYIGKDTTASEADKLIDNNITKLFQCMSIVYRQKLTSPKWNRFLGLKLRWKDKIRINNVIWRCWHMQFVRRQKKLVFAFGNPVEIDNQCKTEAGAIMMGKYWKRKMDSVLAEYKDWRIFYKNQNKDLTSSRYNKPRNGQDDIDLESMITDANFFADAMFSSIESQPLKDDFTIKFLENSDFIQPGLIQLQPNLDDLMDFDPFLSMSDWFSSKQSSSVKQKSLTPEQDLYVHEPKEIVPPTELEIQHHLMETSSNSVQVITDDNVSMNNPNMSNSLQFESPALQQNLLLTNQGTDSKQMYQQTSVITKVKSSPSKRVTGTLNHQPGSLSRNCHEKSSYRKETRSTTKHPLNENSELAKLLRGVKENHKSSNRKQYSTVLKKQEIERIDETSTIIWPQSKIEKYPILVPPPPPGSLPQPITEAGI